MPHAPTTTPKTPAAPTTTKTTTSAPMPDLAARLAAVDADMTVRLEIAGAAIDVNTAHIPSGPVDLADVVTVPLPDTPAPPAPYATPVANLLHRAHHRLLTGGWCKDVLVDEDGARCMLGAIRIEARGDSRLEADAAAVLLDAIRRRFGPIESVPAFNDTWGGPRMPLRLLDEAALQADARGL